MNIHRVCERRCRFGATVIDLATLNAKSSDSMSVYDKDGNKIVSFPDFSVLCRY